MTGGEKARSGIGGALEVLGSAASGANPKFAHNYVAEDQDRQQRRLESQSENVRQTNAAAQQKLLTDATLAHLSQASARDALNLKAQGMALDANQVTLANSLQELLNAPGAKLLQHFDSNSEINAHLEQVGPKLSKQYAVDLAHNNIRLVQNPKGGFDAVEVPKGQGETPIGEGHTLYEYAGPKVDPKTGKQVNTLIEHPADSNMTWDKYHAWNGTTLGNYNSAVKGQADLEAKQAQTQHEKAATTQEFALTAKEQADTKKIIQDTQQGGGAVYAFDGQNTVLTTKGDALNRNLTAIRPVKQGDISKDQHDIKVLNDIQAKSNNVSKAASAMDSNSWSQAAVAAKMLSDNPNTTINTLLKSKVLKNATPQTRDYVIAINSLREASMGMQKVLTGTARTNETQLQALLNTLPGFEPNSDIVQRKMQAFEQNLGMLRQGLPTGTGIENISSTATPIQSAGHKVGDVIIQGGQQFRATQIDPKSGKVLAADPVAAQ